MESKKEGCFEKLMKLFRGEKRNKKRNSSKDKKEISHDKEKEKHCVHNYPPPSVTIISNAKPVEEDEDEEDEDEVDDELDDQSSPIAEPQISAESPHTLIDRCPCPPPIVCDWSGPEEQVVSHLLAHSLVDTTGGEVMSVIVGELNRFAYRAWVRNCLDHYFLIALLKQKSDVSARDKFIATVQLVGSPSDAEKFSYKLELIGQHNKLKWESRVH